jgi:hypothetical protein
MGERPRPRALPAALPLLLEPDEPARDRNNATASGWRRVNGILTRHHDDDARGALVQYILVRYLVQGVQRQQIALETHYSPRQVQAWISGTTLQTYADPVRRQLAALGIGLGRGSVTETSHKRAREVVTASMALLEGAAFLLAGDDRPQAVRIRTLARLLTAGRQPLDAPQYHAWEDDRYGR